MFFRLIQNEWMKLFNRVSTYVMLGILLLGILLTAGFTFFNQTEESDLPDDEVWKQDLQQQNINHEQTIEENFNYYLTSYSKNQQAINNYRIENNISPHEVTNVWKYMDTNISLISLIGIFVIIVGASIVAHEFNKGTIKLLLVRTASRTQILASKFITTILFGLFLLVLLYVLSFLIGSVLFGFEGSSVHLSAIDGEVTERSRALNLAINYLGACINLLILTAMAFMISSIFRSETLAIAISVALLFIGSTVTGALAFFTDFAKYSIFANTNLELYFTEGPMIEGMTLGFSITIIIVHLAVFLFLAFFVFKKRDVSI